MKRALAGALVLALAGIGLVPAPGPLGSDEAGAAECSWQRHSERVVKHVRRGGKSRRVVRKRYWWNCEAVAAVPVPGSLPVASALPAAGPASPGEPELETDPNRVGVKALEYSFTLSRPSIEAGTVTIELNNQGEDPHNLHLEPEGGPEEGEEPREIAETAPHSNRTASFELPAGEYRLWCSLESHDEWGMNATLVVADP